MELAGVVKAREQVVAGTMHYLTVEVIEAGKKKLYEAKVWVKPWLNFRELEEFTPASHSSCSITPADLGVKRGNFRFNYYVQFVFFFTEMLVYIFYRFNYC